MFDDGGAVGLGRPGVGLGRSRAPAQSVWSYQLLLPVAITFSARRETISRALPPGGVDVTGRSLLALAVGRTWKRRRGRSAHFIGMTGMFLEVCPVIIVQSQLTGAI